MSKKLNSTPKSKLKICVVGGRGFPGVQGGVEVHCENLYTSLAEKGCEVIVFTRKQYVDSSIDTYKGVKLVHLPCIKNKFLEAFLHTIHGIFAAKNLHPDILHIHATGPSLFVPIARLLGLKVVMTHHGPDYKREKWGKLAKLVLRLGEFLGVVFSNKVIAISKTVAVKIKNKFKIEATVIPNGIVMPEVLKSEKALKKDSLVKSKYILTVGRFVPEKGFHDLCKAFDHARINTNCIDNNPWKLVIVGNADHEDKYSLQLKEKAGKNKNVVLTGFLTGKPLQELYSHAGLFILPSYYEGLPIALLEAMSYGLSCIVSDISANRNVELPEDRYFKAGEVKALAQKIREFIDKPLSEEERSKQLNMVAEKYNWEKIADETLEVYKNVLGIG